MAITIVQGSSYALKIRLTDKNRCRPWNFEGFTGATAQFFGLDGITPYSVTGLNPETNVLEFDLLPADSRNLLAADSQDFQYQWMQNGSLYIEQVSAQLNVVAQLF